MDPHKHTSRRGTLVRTSRRQFLRTAGLGSATLAAPWIIPRTALAQPGRPGANDRVHIALFGMGVRGKQWVDNLPEIGVITAVADPDRKKAEANTKEKAGRWTVYSDYRKLLDNEQLDGVVCCNTDHAHIHTAITACQAGLDLYVEKPFCHTVAEGRALVELAKSKGTVLQAGTQSRSIPLNQVLLQGIRDGKYGRLLAVVGRTYRISKPTPTIPQEAIPAGLDWDLWQGPALTRPYSGELVKNWLQYRDYSQWTNGGWGAHAYDMIQDAAGADDTGPIEIRPTAMRSCSGEADAYNTPLSVRYASGIEVHLELVRGKGPDVGAIFICEEAKIELNRHTYKSNPPDLLKELPPDPDGEQEVTRFDRMGWMGRCHFRNWLECVTTREQPRAHGELAQRAGTLCCLTTIARICDRPLKWEPNAERFVDDDEANALLQPPRRKGYELPVIG
jgi:hypothetical protein